MYLQCKNNDFQSLDRIDLRIIFLSFLNTCSKTIPGGIHSGTCLWLLGFCWTHDDLNNGHATVGFIQYAWRSVRCSLNKYIYVYIYIYTYIYKYICAVTSTPDEPLSEASIHSHPSIHPSTHQSNDKTRKVNK